MYCISHVIRKGDSLYKISRQYNVRIDDIMKANPFVNVYDLIIDDAICIPVNTQAQVYTNYNTYQVGDNESLGTVLENNHLDLGDLLSLNDLQEIYLQPGLTLKVPITETGESGTTTR